MELSETKNDLQKEVGGYQHVVVLHDIKVVDDALMDTLRELPRGTRNGDCILNLINYGCLLAFSCKVLLVYPNELFHLWYLWKSSV